MDKFSVHPLAQPKSTYVFDKKSCPKLSYYWVMTSKLVEVWVPITELHYVG